MKTESVRSMRDIPTIQGLHKEMVPSNRQQAVTELARMEHEKARLVRELAMWIGHRNRTEKRLQMVEARLAQLQQMLQPQAGQEPPSRGARRSPARKTQDEAEQGQGWRELSIEY